MWTVDQIMNSDPFYVGLDSTLSHCETMMRRSDIRHLLVVNALGHLAGYVGAAAVDSASRTVDPSVRDIIEPVDVQVELNAGVREVIEQMAKSAWDLAVVVDRNHVPLGIVTEHDLMGLGAVILRSDALASKFSSGPIVAVKDTDSAGHALRQMVAHELRHLVVVDDDGRMVGVLSWRDIVRGRVTENDSSAIGHYLPPGPPQYMVLDGALRNAAQRMYAAKIGALPIVDEHSRPLWMVTRTDVMRALILVIASADYLPSSSPLRASTTS